MLAIAADPKHLGAEIGFLSILHTWGHNLLPHPHARCVIRWVHPKYPFLLAVKVLSRVFRGKFVDGVKRAYRQKKIRFPGPTLHWRNRDTPPVPTYSVP